MNEPLCAAVFDLDGTLLDSIADLADAMNAALAADGFPPRTIAECKRFVGDGARRFTERALPEGHRPAATIDAVLERFRNHYASNWAAKTLPYPGIPELLDGLVSRNVSLCVLSNKPEEFTTQMVSQLLARWHFQVVRGERPGVPKKPDPGGALAIAAELGCPPARILYLGDTDTDMRTAVGAGMVPAGVLWGFRDREELLHHGARHLLDHPLDALRLWVGSEV